MSSRPAVAQPLPVSPPARFVPQDTASVPNDLKALPNWIVWRYEIRDAKETKVPYDPKTSQRAKSNDPSTWATFKQASDAADILSGNDYSGIGFMLQGTELSGIDFDGVLHDGKAEPFVLDILKQLGNPYCEVTPSGNGLRAFVRCPALPKGGRKFSRNTDGKYGAEIYSGAEGGRYLTVTGNRFSGNGIPKIADISLPYFLLSRICDEKFKAMWMGDTSAHGADDSAADFALLILLARLTNCDAAKTEVYFSESKLAEREKWRNRQDYRGRSIDAAIAKVQQEENKSTEDTPAGLEFHLPAVATDQIDDYVVQPSQGQMDGWFPLGSPSLIGGASGSAKSTWMMQLLLAQIRREPVLGHATSGRPFLVLMADRGEASHKRTMRRMQMESESIPIKFFTPQTGLAMWQEVVNMIEATSPLPQIVFIEGADFLVEDGNDKHHVTPFMGALQKIATYYHLAIVGSVGSPKSKAGEGYIAKRDNISGTEAWARLAETVVLLQYPKGQDTAAERELTVLPRNAPAESFALIFKQGRLALQTADDKKRSEGQGREVDWVQTQAGLAQNDPTKRWWTRLDMSQDLGLPKTTAQDWITHACAKGWVIEKPGRKGRGRGRAVEYQWNASKTNPLWVEQENAGEPEFFRSPSF